MMTRLFTTLLPRDDVAAQSSSAGADLKAFGEVQADLAERDFSNGPAFRAGGLAFEPTEGD